MCGNRRLYPLRRPARIGRTSITFAAALGLCACAPAYLRPTGYVKTNPDWGTPYGYSVKRIGDDESSVVVKGNPETSKERVAEIALLRAARLTQEQGKTHFLIVQRKTEAMGAHETLTLPLAAGIWIPVATTPTLEPIAILLIRILPIQSSYPPEAIAAAEVIARLSAQFD